MLDRSEAFELTTGSKEPPLRLMVVYGSSQRCVERVKQSAYVNKWRFTGVGELYSDAAAVSRNL